MLLTRIWAQTLKSWAKGSDLIGEDRPAAAFDVLDDYNNLGFNKRPCCYGGLRTTVPHNYPL